MKFHSSSSARLTSSPGFTLVEMLVAAAISSLVIASIVGLGMYTAKSFLVMGNYAALDAQSRNAADVLGRQIRDASALVYYSTNNPSYLILTNSTIGKTVIIFYNNSNSSLYLAETGQPTQTLLTDCNSWTFALYNRAPNVTSTNITFNSATNAAMCKMINMTWKCSRNILGKPFNTETVETAEIVLRNQITY